MIDNQTYTSTKPKFNIATLSMFGLVFCQTLFLYCLLRADPFSDPDSFWHIIAGDQIRSLGKIPTADSWAFTSQGLFWYNLSWLWDAGISWIHDHWGFAALYSITLCTYSVSIGLQSHFAIKQGAKPQLVLLAAYVCACLMLTSLFLRPAMISALFGVIVYQCLSYYRQTNYASWLLPIPLFVVLWVNMHGGFLLVFVLLGIFTFEALWNKRRINAYYITLCALVCLIASGINPYEYNVYDGAFRTLGSPLQNMIIEWLPMNAASSQHQIIVLAVLLVLVLSQFRNPVIPVADRILALVLLIAVVTSVRHILLMSVLILPYLAHCLSFTSARKDWQEKQNQSALTFQKNLSHIAMLTGITCIAAALVTYTLTLTFRDAWLGEKVGFKQSRLLLPEIAFIEKYYPKMRFMNHYDLGGALIYSAHGRIPVFIDGREQTAYPPQLVKDAMHLHTWQGWDKKSECILDQYKIGGLILPNSDSHNKNPYIKEVFKGPAVTIYIRKNTSKAP